jgi:hypothetical protein
VLKNRLYIFILVTCLIILNSYSQEDPIPTVKDTISITKDSIPKIIDTIVDNSKQFDALSPAKAAFYSAVLPGLGQAYNKKYWKIPLVWGTMGAGVYFYTLNSDNYNRARTAYKLRRNDKPDEFNGENGNIFLSEDALIRAQKSYKKDRDLSLLVTVAFYILQIVEASTNAHLLQHDVDDNLSFNPKIIKDITTNKSIVGASINFNF